MVQVDKEILEKNSEIKLLLQIHDDLVFEVPDPSTGHSTLRETSGQGSFNIDELIEKIRRIMCDVYPLLVPIEVGIKIGKSWGEMKTIE
jgi:DNA polymerase I-like protein with 3'-5' exonuclease and polymerase domains